MSKAAFKKPLTLNDLRARAAFPKLEDIIGAAFDDMQPTGRMTVTEAAQEYTRIGGAAGYSTPWSVEKTPYLKEPQNVLSSLDYTGMVFVGPARTGKTVMGLNWVSHTVKTDPGDMLFVHMDRENARKWSNGDLKRFLEASKDVKAEMMPGTKFDNTYDKTFRSGMRFLLTYPTASNLSGITVGKVGFIDYDRMDDDVDGEGNPYDLGAMRTTTFGRFAMTYAESSPNPNKEIKDPRWMPQSPHEAPPIRGIFELYNRGDRRWRYWQCPQCDEWFVPHFKLLNWGGLSDPMEAREAVTMICPAHGCVIEPRMKSRLDKAGMWVPDGGMIDAAGNIVARPGQKIARSSIASFWLFGPAAAYQEWGALVEKFLRAKKALKETGDDGPLRKTVTTDQGDFYIPESRLSDVAPEVLKSRAEDWGSTAEYPIIPEGVRFLVASADVQAGAFVCQITGISETRDLVVIDAFKLQLSNRKNAAGERLPIEPHAFLEDWDVLETELMDRTYPLGDGSGRRMRVLVTTTDSGGHEGVTGHAYNFWRKMKMKGRHRNLILVKGDGLASIPIAQTITPDSSQKDKNAVARGDVPVLRLNSNKLKDQVKLLMLRRVAPEGAQIDGQPIEGRMLRYPSWLADWFYVQLTSEIRTEKGWQNTRQRRNESFDLTYYTLGVILRSMEERSPFFHIGVDRLDFDSRAWSAPWDRNDRVFDPNPTPQNTPEAKVDPRLSKLRELGKKMT